MITDARRADVADDRVDFEQARSLMLGLTEPLDAQRLDLHSAFGRIAAATLSATEDIVPYGRSAMDGFAVCAADTSGAAGGGVTLRLSGALYAGDGPRELVRGTAMAIATGAPLPLGADAVIPVENTVSRDGAIVFAVTLKSGDFVFDPGDDAKRGDVLVRRGDEITPGRAALLAAAGHASLHVHRRPRIALVCTGDEVVAIDRRPAFGQIRNSNAAMLAAHLERDGAEVVSCVAAPDAPGPLRAMLADALGCADLVITTGGASVGQRDFVKAAFTELQTDFVFRSVAMRPAKPTAFGRRERVLVAVLPGNPAAAFVGYAALVRGAVRRLAGQLRPFPATIPARFQGAVRAKPQRHFLMFGKLAYRRGAFTVEAMDNQCSSLVRTSADANALIVIPPGDEHIRSGDSVDVEVFDWHALDFGG